MLSVNTVGTTDVSDLVTAQRCLRGKHVRQGKNVTLMSCRTPFTGSFSCVPWTSLLEYCAFLRTKIQSTTFQATQQRLQSIVFHIWIKYGRQMISFLCLSLSFSTSRTRPLASVYAFSTQPIMTIQFSLKRYSFLFFFYRWLNRPEQKLVRSNFSCVNGRKVGRERGIEKSFYFHFTMSFLFSFVRSFAEQKSKNISFVYLSFV